MKSPNTSFLFSVFVLVLSVSWAACSAKSREDFLRCLAHKTKNPNVVSQTCYGRNNSSFSSVLQFSIQNPRFLSPDTPKPLFIVRPVDESEIKAAIFCSKKHDLQIRVRSGGHDFEGLSYICQTPFVVVDLYNFRSISVDVESETAWVQAGANLGELYYAIAQKSNTLAYPAGSWPTVGVGGQLSGGGYGVLLRKFGLAADHIIDARFMDANGNIFNDRKSMGEDLFWAIRGGGGDSFGVILAFKIKLVRLPEKLTVFTINRTLEQNATKLVHKYQHIAHNIDDDLFLRARITCVNSTQDGHRTIQVIFTSLFLGGVDRMLALMHKSFPELGLVKEDCTEVSWIQATLYFARYKITDPPEILLNRTKPARFYFKGKADLLQKPIAEEDFPGIWENFFKINPGGAELVWTPLGGRMAEISESAIPFPHRAGNLFMTFQTVYWNGEKDGAVSPRHLKWIRRFYGYMARYVSKNPRGGYVCYRDLDLGVNYRTGNTSYAQASIWGRKYFKNNFKKLVQVKTRVDPENVFKSPQSIPPLTS